MKSYLKKKKKRTLFSIKCFIFILFFYLIPAILIYTYKRVTTFNPAAFAAKHAITLDPHQYTEHSELQEKLVIVSGIVSADHTIEKTIFSEEHHFIVLENIEQTYFKYKKRRRLPLPDQDTFDWTYGSSSFSVINQAFIGLYSFNLKDVSFKRPLPLVRPKNNPEEYTIFISHDGTSSLEKPKLNDKRIHFRGIKSGSPITILARLHDTKLVPYYIFSDQTGEQYKMFYLCSGSADDLIKYLYNCHYQTLMETEFGIGLVLFLILLIPFFIVFEELWPTSKDYDYDYKGLRNRRPHIRIRTLIGLGILAIIVMVTLHIFTSLIGLIII